MFPMVSRYFFDRIVAALPPVALACRIDSSMNRGEWETAEENAMKIDGVTCSAKLILVQWN
jgi:hypothetical protein